MDEKPDKPFDSEDWFAYVLLAAVFGVIVMIYIAGLVSVGWGVKGT